MIQLFGSGFGQEGSTVNGDDVPLPGAALGRGADAQPQTSKARAAMRHVTVGAVRIAS
jgi:hypothetical protein